MRGRLLKEYGIDLSKIGKLTPDIVRASSLRLKGLTQQVKLAAKFSQNAEGIESNLNQLEEVRSQMISSGANNLKASDKLLGNAIRTNAKLESSMKNEAAKLVSDLKIEEARSGQQLQQQEATLQGQLRAMAATHDAQMQLINYKSDQNLKQGVAGVKDGYRAAQDGARYARELNNYINGDNSSFRPRLPSFSARGLFR